MKTPMYIQIRSILASPKRAILKTQRLAYLKRRYKNGMISEHFSYREFFCRDGMPFPIRATNHLEWYVKRVLEPMRFKFGVCFSTGPYRHYWYDIRIGGASDSRHDWDKHPDEIAVDMAFSGGNPVLWAEEAARLMHLAKRGGGIGVYWQPRAYFTHVDSRRVRGRWFGSRTAHRTVKW
jgi:hypothetical protein